MTLLLYYSFDGCVEGVEILNRTYEMMTAVFPLFPCPFQVKDLKLRTAAAGLFRLTPWAITQVKEEEACVFTRDKCTQDTACSLLSSGAPFMWPVVNKAACRLFQMFHLASKTSVVKIKLYVSCNM